jgi:hypothetical protein
MGIQFYEQLNIFDELLKLTPFVNYVGMTLRDAWPENAKTYICVYGKWAIPTWVYDHMSSDQRFNNTEHINRFMDYEVFEYASYKPKANDGEQRVFINVKKPGYDVQPESFYQSLLGKRGKKDNDGDDSDGEDSDEENEDEYAEC